ncbi:MAG: glycosyltransferase family 1 protein [Anaerolineae bacterium]|nr:glycosyltransferase family 1 protein [Anaerolineae bacterium]
MKITIIAFGTRGDVQPLIALSLGLQAAGHTVQFVTQARFCDLATSHNISCVPITADVHLPSQKNKETGRLSPYRLYKLARQYAKVALRETWDACKETESLIFSDWGRIPGLHIVEKLNIPAYMSFIHPQQMQFLYPETHVFGPRFNWITSWVRKQLLWHMGLRHLINEWRLTTLGLPPTPFLGNEDLLKKRKIPFFYTFSPSVFPRPDHWPNWFHVTGYHFLNAPPTWTPSTELVDFLNAGPPPVYVGFSSMSNRKIGDMTHLVLKGLTLTKQRGILASGWSNFGKQHTVPDNVFVIDAVPHSWLFPQVAAVIHHGGAGTTGAAFRAGVPNIIIPFALDQPFWAERVQALDVGPPTISPNKLTAEKLASAIEIAIYDQTLRSRAQSLGQKIKTEDGITRAVELFHYYLSKI